MKQADLLQPALTLTEEVLPPKRPEVVAVMPGSVGKERDSKRARFAAIDIEALRASLLAAADARAGWSPAQSRQAVIKAIYPAIKRLLKTGCLLEEVVDLLRGGGLPITEGTLRGYLQKARRPRAAKQRRAEAPLARVQTTTSAPSEMAPQFDVESL